MQQLTLRYRLALLLALAAVTFAVAAGSAQAGSKPYSVNITPASVAAGSQTELSATFSVPAGAQQQLGSARLTAPVGLQLVSGSASLSGAGSASISGSTVALDDLSLQPGQSVTLLVTAKASCTPGALAWTVAAKQSNQFNGTGNDLNRVGPAPSTTVTGACGRLRFVTQPAGGVVGAALTGAPLGSGPPVSVEVVDGSGNRLTGSTIPITIAKGTGSAGGALTGTLTKTAVLGLASFADLKLDTPGAYTLQASSPGLTSVTTSSFRVDSVGVACTEDVTCSASTSTSTTKATLTALGTPSSVDVGFLSLSFNAGPAIDCAGYDEASPDTAVFDFRGANRVKVIALTVSKQRLQIVPNNGAAFLNFCFGSPVPFVTTAGPLTTPSGTYDWDLDGTQDPVYVGLLPSCGGAAPPCVSARKKVGAGDGYVEATLPAGLGDPWARG